MSIRILLADESSTIKKAFEIGLNSYGAEIKNVQHGIDVIEVAETFKPDVIFADVLISKMNGYEVCAQIKSHPGLQHTPVVLMWSGFMDIDEDKYITCQADGKIEKPFSADQLIELIQGLIQNSPAQALAQTKSTPPSVQNDRMTVPPGLGSRVLNPPIQTTPPPIPMNAGTAKPSMPSVVKRQANPAEELLFKEDIKIENDLFGDLSSNSSTDSEADDFNLDGFEALDLQDNSKNNQTDPFGFNAEEHLSENKNNQNHNFNSSFLDIGDEEEETKEVTSIPTAEQERILFDKLKEDTAIRHGSGFLNHDGKKNLSADPNDHLSALESDSFDPDDLDLVDLSNNFDDLEDLSQDLSLDDLRLNPLDQEIYGKDLAGQELIDQDLVDQDLMLKTKELDNVFSNPEEKLSSTKSLNTDLKTNLGSKTIHRNVADIHNSDAGFSPVSNTAANSSSQQVSSAPGVGQLSREEIKAIISEQAKDVIQSIVWELIPELSKQMIEKEIKRLMAESSDDAKPNSF